MKKINIKGLLFAVMVTAVALCPAVQAKAGNGTFPPIVINPCSIEISLY